MKKIITIIIIITSLYSYGQKDTITTDVYWPLGIAADNNALFVVEPYDDLISSVDLNFPNATPIDFKTGLVSPGYLVIVDDYLYYTDNYLESINRVDKNLTNPTSQLIISGLHNVDYIVKNGNDLYFTEDGKISKIDADSANPTKKVIYSTFNQPKDLAFYGNELFFSESVYHRISKIDINNAWPSPSIVISGLSGPVGPIAIHGTDLYFAEIGSKKISKIDISISTPYPTVTTIDNDVTAADMFFVGNDLYVSDYEDHLILKYTNIALSSDSAIHSTPDFTVFPNPANEFISIEGVNELTTFKIYNALGIMIKEDDISQSNSRIDISSFDHGLYVIELENGWTASFIKK